MSGCGLVFPRIFVSSRYLKTNALECQKIVLDVMIKTSPVTSTIGQQNARGKENGYVRKEKKRQ